MAEISRAALFGKLNQVGYKAIEAATVFCKMQGNPNVELVHWIHQILQLQDSDLHRIIRQFTSTRRIWRQISPTPWRDCQEDRRVFQICLRTSKSPSSAVGWCRL